ncbi:MAG: helix-turn-helix domain-containing protein [Gammaproteobacteria bacterium]|nr:helix-turn-helix domain-containing protein [Gammaproteobacteria bacterium]MDP2139596.1 helix-turn-helix domain-containing protein [Gammaproteobacteria bacterium]MDP2346569.1 helix-turn-helix domain-containing protein [Gammaproteobacteria bacterium]
MTRVAILSYNYTAFFELGCAVELFALPRPEFDNWYQTEVISFESGPLTVTGGMQILPRVVTSLDDYDMLVIPSWSSSQPEVPEVLQREVVNLRARGGRLLSFCSGSFLLAEIGLLDGLQATTHWRYAEKFKARYPRVSYVEDVLYVYDGRIGCSAGSAAGIDLGIEVIRGDFGYEVANQVARRLVIAAHRSGGQAQFVETPIIEKPNQFAAALDWAIANLDKPIDIDQLAERARMARRTFDRRFRASLGMTPKDWLTRQRLQMARGLLESSNHPMDVIAGKCGFDNAMTMRHHFRRLMQLSPGQFREQFGRN